MTKGRIAAIAAAVVVVGGVALLVVGSAAAFFIFRGVPHVSSSSGGSSSPVGGASAGREPSVPAPVAVEDPIPPPPECVDECRRITALVETVDHIPDAVEKQHLTGRALAPYARQAVDVEGRLDAIKPSFCARAMHAAALDAVKYMDGAMLGAMARGTAPNFSEMRTKWDALSRAEQGILHPGATPSASQSASSSPAAPPPSDSTDAPSAASASSASSAPSASASGSQTVSGGALDAKATKRVQPETPPAAKSAHAAGPVVVSLLVGESGRVETAEAVSGHPLLRSAAVAAAKQWTFAPTQLGGRAVKVKGTITLTFS